MHHHLHYFIVLMVWKHADLPWRDHPKTVLPKLHNLHGLRPRDGGGGYSDILSFQERSHRRFHFRDSQPPQLN
ncbi:hypothetical protein KSP40_PGU017387 [Platanthera guangdongensis]|uniref:Secreted protein n=1 Tax=Platanthera guangdongensis TaxID=2320717 RepID=A0ABR2M609_9ASPA